MIFIIAELGTNHLGDIKIVKKLIDVAVSAGCNAVKLQKRNVEKIFTKEFLKIIIISYLNGSIKK